MARHFCELKIGGGVFKGDSGFGREAIGVMKSDEAKILLGFSPHSAPCHSQIKPAYRRKVWETHPDRFPPHLKAEAESNFKLVSEAYTLLNSPAAASYNSSYSCRSRVRVVRRSGGVPSSTGGHGMRAVASLPFFLIISAALAIAGSTASRAYRRQKEAHPCFNPFLP